MLCCVFDAKEISQGAQNREEDDAEADAVREETLVVFVSAGQAKKTQKLFSP